MHSTTRETNSTENRSSKEDCFVLSVFGEESSRVCNRSVDEALTTDSKVRLSFFLGVSDFITKFTLLSIKTFLLKMFGKLFANLNGVSGGEDQ